MTEFHNIDLDWGKPLSREELQKIIDQLDPNSIHAVCLRVGMKKLFDDLPYERAMEIINEN